MKAAVISAVVALTFAGCASMERNEAEHAAHHPEQQATVTRADQQMQMMQDMHQKMAAAKTPQERQALMAEHMKAMQGGMAMMCEMGQMSGNPGPRRAMPMAAAGSGQAEMMQRCTAMRDMTMRMMMERETAPK